MIRLGASLSARPAITTCINSSINPLPKSHSIIKSVFTYQIETGFSSENFLHSSSSFWISRRSLSFSRSPLSESSSPKKGSSSWSEQERSHKLRLEERHKTVLYYLCALGVLVVGASYAAVPLYRIFCQSYSYGGTVATHAENKDLSKMKKVKNRQLTIKFNADKSSSLQWNFLPRQAEIILSPGETALAFYTAKNSTNRPVDGISTYNVIPYEVGQYFNKIQCFCFEEQRLNPGETVELPVFFYIDPEFSNDPKMENVDTILLSYTFFEAKELPNLNLPSFSFNKAA